MSYRLYGAIGFGIGGFISGLSGDWMIFSLILFGFIGSAVLTIPARSMKLTMTAGILGAIGFFFGFSLPMFVFLTYFELPSKYLFIGLSMGLLGGGLLGIAFRNVKDFVIWGTLGFGLSWWLTFSTMEWFRTSFPDSFSGIVMMIASAVGGACLGHAASLTKAKKK